MEWQQLRAHFRVAKVQELGITALANIADDNHEGSGAVVAAGGVTTIGAGMLAHVGVTEVQKQGGFALKHLAHNGYGRAVETAAVYETLAVASATAAAAGVFEGSSGGDGSCNSYQCGARRTACLRAIAVLRVVVMR